VGLVLLGLLAALAVAVPAQAATPGEVVLLDTDPEYASVTVNTPGGGTATTSPGQFSLQVTPAGGAPAVYPGFCIDTEHPIATGVAYSVSLQTAADDPSLASPAANSAAWLIQESDALIAAAADPALEAGALQVAVWVVLGEAIAGTPTDDDALNARATALVALAAGKGPAGPVAISAAAASTCAGGPGTTLSLTGTPGGTATLAVSAGQATLSASQVTFSAAGTASVTLTSAAVGPVTVTASSAGAELTRATRLPGAGAEPQETGFLTPRTYTAQVSVTFTNCAAATTTPTPVTTPKPAVQQTPALRVTKTGAKSVLAGRAVPYTIVVRNTSKVIARSVVVTDTLPAGMAYLRSSLRPTSVGKRIVWRIGNLAPGRSRTLTVWLQAPTGLSGTRTNVVEVSAERARTVRDTATTQFRRVRAQLQPAVTG
jgi:uncharacterized repeat protein (TIGR01451 family)